MPEHVPTTGEIAPDFCISDAHGVQRDFASLTGPNGLVLIFYRGHW